MGRTICILWLVVVVTAVAGCSQARHSSDSVMGVAFTTSEDDVPAGSNLELVLENGSSERIGYNLCTSTLEQQSGSEWRPVPSDRVCTMELRTLEPGESGRYVMQVEGNLQTGEYRYRTGVEWMETGKREMVASPPFRVRATR